MAAEGWISLMEADYSVLSKRVDRFSPSDPVREEPAQYGIEDENDTRPRDSERPNNTEFTH